MYTYSTLIDAVLECQRSGQIYHPGEVYLLQVPGYNRVCSRICIQVEIRDGFQGRMAGLSDVSMGFRQAVVVYQSLYFMTVRMELQG